MIFIPDIDYNIPSLLFFIFILMGITQVFFTIFIHGKLAFYKKKKSKENTITPPITVIISARNESYHLYENLPYILEQDYPNF